MPEPTAAELDRVGAWLRAEAASKSLEDIRDYIASRRDRLRDTVLALEPSRLSEPLAPGEWSAIDALKHVVEWTAQNAEDILHACLTGERPGNPPPTFEADRDELLGRLDESLDSVWAHVSAADPESFLDTTWEHFMFGELNWREWYLFLGVHLSDHTGQLKQAAGA